MVGIKENTHPENLASHSVVPQPAESVSPWCLLQMQNLGFHPTLTEAELHLNKMLKCFACTSIQWNITPVFMAFTG